MELPQEDTDPSPSTDSPPTRPSIADGLLGNSLGSRLTTAEYDPSMFTSPLRGEEAVSRTLVSSTVDLTEAVETMKRASTDALVHNRLKKKKTAPASQAETRSSALLQSIVPKLGPVLRFKSRDSDQLKKAVADVQSRQDRSVELGMNYLLGWSLVEKGETPVEDVLEVLSSLLDYVLDVMTAKATTATELFESSLRSEVVSNELKRCMAAGQIMKNMSFTAAKPGNFAPVNDKIVKVVLCLLSKKMPQAESALSSEFICVDHVPYSLARDLLFLLKTVQSVGDECGALLAELAKTMYNKNLPLRLRTSVVDVLSVFMYQASIKDELIAFLKTNRGEFMMHLKTLIMISIDSALEEAEFEFEGGLDYEEVAVLADRAADVWKEELRLWAWRLQAEAILCSTTFLTALASCESADLFAHDDYILQLLVDLTTGKKLMDVLEGDRSFLESKHEVVATVRRHLRSSEMHAYRIILDSLQKDVSVIGEKLQLFEDQFVVSGFDNTWQAKQCAMVLSMMKTHNDS